MLEKILAPVIVSIALLSPLKRETSIDDTLKLKIPPIAQTAIRTRDQVKEDFFEAVKQGFYAIDNDKYYKSIGFFKQSLSDYKTLNMPAPALESNLHYQIGLAYFKLGDFDDAQKEHKIAYELTPNDTRALNNIAYTISFNPNADSADIAFAQEAATIAVTYKPDKGEFHGTLGRIYFRKGEYEKAIEQVEDAIKLIPEKNKDSLIPNYQLMIDIYSATNNKEKINFYKNKLNDLE